jgi:TetR/AcrR family transcriptional regulator
VSAEPKAVARKRPAKRSDDRRERILEVAVDEFAQKGFAGARVDAIARRARANKQLVYYYFGGKLGLYTAVLGRMIEGAQEKIVAESQRSTLKGKLQTMAGRSTDPNAVRWQRLLAWEALDGSAEEMIREDERRETWQRHVVNVKDAQASGEVDPDLEPDLLALALVSVIVSPYVLPQITKLMTGLLPGDEKFLERQDALLGQLIDRLGPRA